MKKITVEIDNSLYQRACAEAAKNHTTVSAMVQAYFEEIAREEVDPDRLRQQQNEIIERIQTEHKGFSAESRLTRDDTHDRKALR